MLYCCMVFFFSFFFFFLVVPLSCFSSSFQNYILCTKRIVSYQNIPSLKKCVNFTAQSNSMTYRWISVTMWIKQISWHSCARTLRDSLEMKPMIWILNKSGFTLTSSHWWKMKTGKMTYNNYSSTSMQKMYYSEYLHVMKQCSIFCPNII